MILKIERIGLSIEADDNLLFSLLEKGKFHYPNEYGGFLIGRYTNGNKHLVVLDTVLPESFKTSKYSFERSTKGIFEKLSAFYNEDPKKFYIGEWHTHPDNNSNPSLTDISAIKTIAKSENSFLANPVLLIIGYSKTAIDFGFYVWFQNKILKYE